jgi:hypothetical protein
VAGCQGNHSRGRGAAAVSRCVCVDCVCVFDVRHIILVRPDHQTAPRTLSPGGLPEITGLMPRASAAMSTLEFSRCVGCVGPLVVCDTSLTANQHYRASSQPNPPTHQTQPHQALLPIDQRRRAARALRLPLRRSVGRERGGGLRPLPGHQGGSLVKQPCGLVCHEAAAGLHPSPPSAQVRLMAKEHLGRYANTFDCLGQVLRTEGPQALLIGLAPTLWRNCECGGGGGLGRRWVGVSVRCSHPPKLHATCHLTLPRFNRVAQACGTACTTARPRSWTRRCPRCQTPG